MKLIVLAAGKSSRLYPLTLEKPKCLLPMGQTMIIDRLLSQFKENGVDDTVVAVGYKKEMIEQHLNGQVRFRNYQDFAKTNNLYTLLSIADELNEDCICTFADIIIDDAAIKRLTESTADMTLMVDTNQVLESTMGVAIQNNLIQTVGSHVKDNAVGNFIGMAKFTKQGAQVLKDKMKAIAEHGHENDYYTIAIDALAKEGYAVNALDIAGTWWREIDTKEEYDEALAHVDALSHQ